MCCIFSGQPRTLQDMCRINIRNRIGLQSLKFLEDLPIAKVMKDYLKHKFDNVWWQEFFFFYIPHPPEPGRQRTSFSPFIRLCKHCATFRCLKPGGGGGPGFCTTSRGHFVTSVKHAVGWWRRSIFLSRACFQPRYQRYAFGWTGTGGSVSSRAFFQSWWMVDEVVQS